MERNAKLVESLQDLWINLIFRLYLLLWSRIERDLVIIDRIDMNMSPCRSFLRKPVSIGIEAELQHPFWLTFLLRNQANHILIESRWDDFCINVGREAILIFARSDFLQYVFRFSFFIH